MLNYNLEFKDLESFITLYRYRSFTKAAENLYITQSALSRRIKALEGELDVQLVTRGGTSCEITAAGHQFYKSCVKMIQEKDNIYVSMNRFRTGEEGGLRLAADPNFFDLKPIVAAITELRENYPRIQVRYESSPNLDVRRALTEEDIDIAFTFRSVAEDYPELRFTEVGQNRMVIGVGRQHRLFARELIQWEELNGEKLVEARQTNNMAFNKLMQQARNQGCEFCDVQFVTDTEEALCLVAAGEYLTIHGESGVEAYEPLREYVRFVPVQEDDDLLVTPVAAYRADNDNPLIQKLLTVIRTA